MLVVVAAFTLLVVVPSQHKAALPGGVSEAGTSGSFDGNTLIPVKAAPPTTLRNYLGQSVSLSQYRGKAVFVTFLYTHCPDVCPLIATNLRATQTALGAENAKVEMLAISVDPRGDTRGAVADFLRVHGLVGRIQYLVGSAAQLGPVWAAWNVGTERDAGAPELVAHSAFVYGISATGELTTIYGANFRPSQLVHDVPLLVSR
jgi:protein SCO1